MLRAIVRPASLLTAVVVGSAVGALFAGGRTEAYTAKVENACRADYFSHCPGYPVGSASLRLCMEAKSKQLSSGCIDALVKAGLVDRRRIARGH